MERNLKPISTGNPNFREIIESNSLYIDKTKYIYNLVASKSIDKTYFLSRPRRFGKSLTIDTLEHIFRGDKELFKGLYIYDKYDFEEYPVVRLSMISVNSRDIVQVRRQLMKQVEKVGKDFGVLEMMDLSVETPSDYLDSLIDSLNEKTGKQVVILIDEYDYPLMENIRSEAFESVRDEMANFYNMIKAKENMIRFCFLTGVTRFQHVSIFSKLNNLTDISDSPEYAALCGYTDEELDYYFAPYIQKYYEDNNIVEQEEREAFRKSIKDYYDGYRFSIRNDVTMYNPVSIGKFFNGGCSFDNFWIETGAQSLVNEIIRKYPDLFKSGKVFYTYESAMSTMNVSDIMEGCANAESVYSYLVQAGYMTISGTEYGKLLLSYPNREVGDTMNAKVLATYGIDIDGKRFPYLYEAFATGDTEGIIAMFRDAYMNIPYDMFMEKENNYQIAFYSALMFLGFESVEAEEKTNIGRMDISVKVKDDLYYIIELKLDESAEKALKQIKEKRYYEKYEKKGSTIHLLGINFSSKERNIRDWKEEILLK